MRAELAFGEDPMTRIDPEEGLGEQRFGEDRLLDEIVDEQDELDDVFSTTIFSPEAEAADAAADFLDLTGLLFDDAGDPFTL